MNMEDSKQYQTNNSVTYHERTISKNVAILMTERKKSACHANICRDNSRPS